MLQKPDVHTSRLLETADFIEKLPDGAFNMGRFSHGGEEPRCICGWVLHNNAYIDNADTQEAARLLGLDRQVAYRLFHENNNWTQKQAARALRHLAVTGELVDAA